MASTTEEPPEERTVQHLVVRLPADLHAAVKARAKKEERSIAQTIRFALKQYLGEAS